MKKTFRLLSWIVVITALATAACDFDGDERRGERSEEHSPPASSSGGPSSGAQPGTSTTPGPAGR